MMVGIAVAEDEAPFAVGRVPVDHPDAGVSAHLADYPLRDINAVVKNGAGKTELA